MGHPPCVANKMGEVPLVCRFCETRAFRNLPWKRKGNREGHDVQSCRKTQEKEQRFSA